MGGDSPTAQPMFGANQSNIFNQSSGAYQGGLQSLARSNQFGLSDLEGTSFGRNLLPDQSLLRNVQGADRGIDMGEGADLLRDYGPTNRFMMQAGRGLSAQGGPQDYGGLSGGVSAIQAMDPRNQYLMRAGEQLGKVASPGSYNDGVNFMRESAGTPIMGEVIGGLGSTPSATAAARRDLSRTGGLYTADRAGDMLSDRSMYAGQAASAFGDQRGLGETYGAIDGLGSVPNAGLAAQQTVMGRADSMGAQQQLRQQPGATGAAQSQFAGSVGSAVPRTMNQYLNPYQDQVINQLQRRIRDQRDESLNNVRGQAAQSNAFGGARQGLVESQVYEDSARAENEAISSALQSGFTTAAGLGQQQQGLEQAAAQGMLGVGAQDIGRTVNYGQLAQGQGAQDIAAGQALTGLSAQDIQRLSQQGQLGLGATAARSQQAAGLAGLSGQDITRAGQLGQLGLGTMAARANQAAGLTAIGQQDIQRLGQQGALGLQSQAQRLAAGQGMANTAVNRMNTTTARGNALNSLGQAVGGLELQRGSGLANTGTAANNANLAYNQLLFNSGLQGQQLGINQAQALGNANLNQANYSLNQGNSALQGGIAQNAQQLAASNALAQLGLAQNQQGIGAAQTALQYAQTGQQMGQGALSGQAASGAQIRGLNQELLDRGAGQFDSYVNRPTDALATALAGITGNPLAGAGTTTGRTQPGLFDYLGLGAGLGSSYLSGKGPRT